jgi:hypothetical protein
LHFLRYVKNSTYVLRRKSKRELAIDYSEHTGLTFNGIFEEDYLADIFNEGSFMNLQIEEDINVNKYINQLKSETEKRILNLMILGCDLDQIQSKIKCSNRVNLRQKIHNSRKHLFEIMKQNGHFKEMDFTNVNCSKLNHKYMDIENLRLDNKYLYVDYPLQGSYVERIVFLLKKHKHITESKLIGLIALNNGVLGDRSQLKNIKKYMDKALIELESMKVLHIESKKEIFLN